MTWVYIARCADGSFYTGITTDLVRRASQHNGDQAGGAKYTRSRRPVELIYYIAFNSTSEALREEARIKRLTRAEKEALINAATNS